MTEFDHSTFYKILGFKKKTFDCFNFLDDKSKFCLNTIMENGLKTTAVPPCLRSSETRVLLVVMSIEHHSIPSQDGDHRMKEL